MKDGKTTVILNERGILGIGFLILALTFALGFVTSNMLKETNETVFTKEELNRIMMIQNVEDREMSGAEVYAYKDKDGNLMIGRKYDSED